ncbi:hypothetical protein JYK21_04700 [Ralstonia pickettii]|nr:hypothetical protein [Ralstonia pickettii]
MKFYTFSKDSGNRVTQFNSEFIMSRVVETDGLTRIGCMHLEENGIIGYHQAIVPQLLLIVNGEGLVRSKEDEYSKVQAGDAVFWEKGEWHETKSEKGLIAIVIESEKLNPSEFMSLSNLNSK